MTAFQNIKIVIADDHPMLLQGLKATLTGNGLNVVAAAKDGTSALQAIIDHQCELAILDVEMPYLSGFAIADECRKIKLDTKFIMLSYHKEPEFIVQAQNLNISGYLLKEDTSTEILKCIELVMSGAMYYSPAILNTGQDHVDKNLVRLASLSPSEKKILKLIATSLSSEEIANQLHVSERTIEKHRSNIISKLGLSGQAHSLSMWAIEQKTMIMNL